MRFHFVSFLGRTPWGGCEELWSHAALRLQQSGETVSASVRWWPESRRHPRIGELAANGAKLSFWAKPGAFYRSWLAHGLNRVTSKAKLGRPLRAVDYQIKHADLVVFSSGGNDFPVEPIRLCRRRGQRYVLIIHSVNESAWPRDDELQEWRYIYEGAEAAYFVSDANRTSTVFQLGFDSEKFQVVRNPFNVPWDTPVTWPVAGPTHQWAFVGRLEPGHKGVDLLLRAFAHERWERRDLRINFYGGGLCERSVKNMAEMLRLGSRACFRGQVADLEGIWRKNELLVLPSRHEGLPLVVVEAMLFGRPCLVTDVSGNAELLEDGVTGFIAGGPTVAEVDAALEKAWENRHRLREMGEAAYRSIRNQIPREPVQIFAQRLRDVASSGETAPVFSSVAAT